MIMTLYYTIYVHNFSMRTTYFTYPWRYQVSKKATLEFGHPVRLNYIVMRSRQEN